MKRLYVLVEGQTEEEFVKRVVAPHLLELQLATFAIVVETSRDRSGRKRRGGGHWKHWFRDLMRLTRQQVGPGCRFSTMFDLYGLPADFPQLTTHSAIGDTNVRADALAQEMALAVNDYRFIPYVQRHEFEALVLAALTELRSFLDESVDLDGVSTLQSLLNQCAPEDINDSPDTAPSKRLESLIPGYRKSFHGPLAVERAGLHTLRLACPRFNDWVVRLEGLAEAPADASAHGDRGPTVD